MRITILQQEHLVSEILRHRPKAEIYLFGSRADDNAKGGDIDILILHHEKLTIAEQSTIRRSFWQAFGVQKVDLVCFTPDSKHPFKQLALLNAIPLNGERTTS